mgnify:CR=1 FL=1
MDIPVLDTQTPQLRQSPVTMTENAGTIVRTLLEEKNIPDYHLRVFVQGGGCSGMQYGMAFEAAPRAGDTVLELSGVKLLIDPQSMGYLQGAQIDYVDSLMGGGFRIDNPNAVTSCGCGHSFRTAGASSAASAAQGGGGCGCG